MSCYFKKHQYFGFQNLLGYQLPNSGDDHYRLEYQVPRTKLAQKHAKKLRTRVKKHAASGGSKFKTACRDYLSSYDALITAVVDVNKSKPLSKRRSLNECFEEADKQMANEKLKYPATVHRITRSKPNTFRHIWDFSPLTAARQKLLADCVRALIPRPHPSWLYTERGAPKAIARLIQLIEQGRIWVAELDITEFYPTISKKALLPKLSISKKVVEEVAFATNAIARSPGGDTLIGSRLSSARRGLPQGARSSTAIALWIMLQLNCELSNGVHLIVYADNLFLVASTRQEVEAAAKSMVEAVASLPGGHFKLKEPVISSVDQGINALGHSVKRDGDIIRDYPNAANIGRYHERIDAELTKASKLLMRFEETQDPLWRDYAFAELAGLRAYETAWKKCFKDSFHHGPHDLADPANGIHYLMSAFGLTDADLNGWENGKVQISSNPSQAGSEMLEKN